MEGAEAMSYTYMAMSAQDGLPLAVTHRKHDLAYWLRRERDKGYPSGGWMSIYRVRFQFWDDEIKLTELELVGDELIEKVP